MHSWSIIDARMNHGQTWTHKNHHNLDLGEATIFPLIIFFVPGHGAYTQMLFCPEIGTLVTLDAHNIFCRPLIEINSKKKLWPSSRPFQRYVTFHLHASKSGQFPTFSGQEFN
jgi:hypothetical protein